MRSWRWAAALGLSCTVLLASACLTAGAQKKAPAAAKGSADAGKKVYAKYCPVCHAIKGVGGKLGTDLTKVGKTRNAAWLTTEIRTPKKYFPKGTMPAYAANQISDKDLKDLVAYLGTLK